MREWLPLTVACLAVASIGPLLVSIGTRLFRLLRASVRRCGNRFLFSQRRRPVSLWNEVPLTLIARRWPCAFFLSDSKGMLDVKDTVLRRELASIALATRKTKNFFRGMLSAFRAGVSVFVGFHKPCCLVICSLQSPWLGVIFFYHMSHVCNHGTDQSDRRTNVARFCDLICTLELWTGTCFASTESADSSHVRLQISALGRIFAISHG